MKTKKYIDPNEKLVIPDNICNSAERVAKYCRPDSDSASLIAFGQYSIEDASEVVIVIRGKENCAFVRRVLIDNRLLTDGKPIIDAK